MATVLTLEQFRAAWRSGGLESVAVRASGGEFFVTAQPRIGGRVTLATTHGLKPRAFRDVSKAVALLYGLGAHNIQVDTSRWSPEKATKSARKRPDTAERQRRAHEAVAYDAWFRSEVEKAVREADSPDAKWVSSEEVERRFAARRTARRRKAA